MKKLILSVAVIAAAISAQAQAKTTTTKMDQKFRFSLGLETALPVGDFNKISSFGIGGSVQGDYWVDPSLAITLNTGYINFSGKDVTTTVNVPGFPAVTTTYKYPSFGFIPVLAGIKYNFSSGPGVYGSAQLGLSFSSQSGGGSSFTYAPGIGYNFSNNFDALLKYTGYSSKGGGSSLSTIGLRLAYTF